MPTELLKEGLRNALIRGENINQAIASFINAGYDRTEVEEAARNLQVQPQSSVVQKEPEQKSVQVKNTDKQLSSTQEVSDYSPEPKPQSKQTQEVSDYEQKSNPGKTLIIVLIVIFILLFSLLSALFIFKEELINLFDKLFGNA